MYSHRHLAAYLYVAFGSVFNKTTESLPSSPRKLPDDWDLGLKCLTPLSNRSDGLIKADSLHIDGPGCAVTLNCLLDERSTPTPSVNVTFTLPNDNAINLRQCKEGLEELILGGRGDAQVKKALGGHRKSDVEHNRSYRKEPTFLSSRHSEDSSETVPGEKNYRGVVDYLLSKQSNAELSRERQVQKTTSTVCRTISPCSVRLETVRHLSQKGLSRWSSRKDHSVITWPGVRKPSAMGITWRRLVALTIELVIKRSL